MKTLIIACLMAATALPQTTTTNPTPPKFYRLEFNVKELEAGRVVTSHEYTAMGALQERTEIRLGDRVPVPNGKEGFTYLDVGVNITATPFPLPDGRLEIVMNVDLTNVGAKTDVGPVLRTSRWNSRVVVPLKKPTLVFTSDATSDKKQVQLEITATPIL